MGGCFSKKKGSSSASSSVAAVSSAPKADLRISQISDDRSGNNNSTLKVKEESGELKMKLKMEKKTGQATQDVQQVKEDEGGLVKKEIFVIKHRRSHEGRDRGRDSRSPPPLQDDPLAPHGLASATAATTTSSNEAAAESLGNKIAAGVGVRTSSCTKEEVDAILIQCGRLSRSSSGRAASSSASASCDRGRKYSGSKRSYDFDRWENEVVAADNQDDEKKADVIENNDPCQEEERRHHRQRHRQSPRKASSSQGRRRTPSRERDQQRSSSRERRVSRSPGRRSSETGTPASTTTGSACATANAGRNGNRPGKMVSVPATVSSLVMDKSNNGGGGESAPATVVKRISVKRNAGNDAAIAGSRSAASPRSRSPARANANGKTPNDTQQQPSLSRSSSRKAEQSPYRRQPLSEIDPNSIAYPQPLNNHNSSSSCGKIQQRSKKEIEGEGILLKDTSKVLNQQKPNAEIINSGNNRAAVEGTNYKTSSRGALDNQFATVNCILKEQQQLVVEEAKEQPPSMTGHVTIKTVVPSGAESLKPQTLTRSRSSRRSRDLDLNPETLLNPTPSYTTMLLEDIQNFHQKNMNPTSVSLPPCVTKACSILEAVADLNSTTSSNLSCAFSEDRRSPPTYQSNRNGYNFPVGSNLVGKAVAETKDPFIESEVAVTDDVMEPSFHKYVTVRRGGTLGGDMEDQESSGSNSFVGSGQQHWGFSSSSWEPNSADSTDCWTSRLNTRDDNQKSPLGFEGNFISQPSGNFDEARTRLGAKKRDCDHQHSGGIGRGRLGVSRGPHSTPVIAAAAST